MVVDTANTQLITGDIEGFVCRWDIRLFCKDKTSLTRPKCKENLSQFNLSFNCLYFLLYFVLGIIKWRAHTSIINR